MCCRSGIRRVRCSRLGSLSQRCGESKAGERRCTEEEEEVHGGGQLLQMMTSFELSERRVDRVDLYPKVLLSDIPDFITRPRRELIGSADVADMLSCVI
jgi:hypothetical protein